MKVHPPAATRRQSLRWAAGLAALPLAAFGRPARASAALAARPFPDGARVLVGGPSSGRLDRWARLLAPQLALSLPPATGIHPQPVGGPDGVTAANAFATRIAPDGTTTLLAPGEAALAWLVGDSRTHYDVGFWVPVLAGVTPGVIVGRGTVAALGPGRPVRLGASGPATPDLAALLGLDLLGVNLQPVFGLRDPRALHAALAQGTIDAALLSGEDVPNRLATLAPLKVAPLLTLGTPDDTGALQRDRLFPAVPHLSELLVRRHGRPPAGAHYDAFRAAAAAAQLDFALVLPQLSPSAMIALWRQAGVKAMPIPSLAMPAQASALRLRAAPGAAASLAPIATSTAALLDLRHWLAVRFNYHPG